MKKLLEYARNLKFDEAPDYEYIKNLIKQVKDENEIKVDDEYEWSDLFGDEK